MLLQCLPPSFGSIQLTVREQTTTEDFQDGHPGCHLAYCKEMTLAILNLPVTQLPPTKFWLNPTPIWKQMSFGDLQNGRHGGHLGYWNWI